MDGRFLVRRDPDEVRERFQSQMIQEGDLGHPRKTRDIYPTQLPPVIVEHREGQREAPRSRWGLVPRRPRADGTRAVCPIEARSETMFELPMFHELARFRRCIVPMSGYYEWHPDETGKKRPYYITARDGELWGVAGLWDETHREGSDAAGSFAIVTMPANRAVARVHPRMPVILRREHEAAWLSTDVTDAREIRRLVQPYPETEMRIYRIRDAANNTRHRPRPIEPEFKQTALW